MTFRRWTALAFASCAALCVPRLAYAVADRLAAWAGRRIDEATWEWED